MVSLPSRFSPGSKSGNFTVEFAIVGLAFAAALAFASDSVISLSIKGKLDRLAYSGVSLIKERTTLFEEDEFFVTDAEFQQIDTIVKGSLARVLSNFKESKYGIRLETWSQDKAYLSRDLGGIKCSISSRALDQRLSVITSKGRSAALYRVTLCYEAPNFFGYFYSNEQAVVHSDALMIGR